MTLHRSFLVEKLIYEIKMKWHFRITPFIKLIENNIVKVSQNIEKIAEKRRLWPITIYYHHFHVDYINHSSI